MSLISHRKSLSRSSQKDGGLSRSKSVSNKNVDLFDNKSWEVLVDRFGAWKAVVKQLIAYFEGIADIQTNTAKELTKLAGVIQVPFRSGDQFLNEGGLQDVFTSIRDKTRVTAEEHASLARTIDTSILQQLMKLKAEIKTHIKNIQTDTGKLAAGVTKERELSAKLISELSHNITAFQSTPLNTTSRTDPYLANQAVARQLQKQVVEENSLQKSIIIMQQNSAQFEESIVLAIQSAWQTFEEWQSRASVSTQETFRAIGQHVARLPHDKEWKSFASHSDHLLDPQMPLRDPAALSYPQKDDPSVVPARMGHLERKKRYTRAYKESFFVLSPAGFLHSFPSSDPGSEHAPDFSLFLPTCTLGPPSGPDSKSHKFHIEGRKDSTGASSMGGSIRRTLGSKSSQHAWSFKARSKEEMMGWWEDMRALCARSLEPSEGTDRRGPVLAAVRGAGYASEEEGEEERGGSSFEEMEAAPPGYHHDRVRAAGYPIDKKTASTDDPSDESATVVRHPSTRQQEKAPEGRVPHALAADSQHTQALGGAGPSIDRTAVDSGADHSPLGGSTAVGPSKSVHVVIPPGGKGGDAEETAASYAPAGGVNAHAAASTSNPPGPDAPRPAPVGSRFQEGL